jgi:PIN domain nuclease of toxin-antitoxin system
MAAMIYLDTNVVVRMFTSAHMVSPRAQRLINRESIFISPMVELELQYLNEIGRIKYRPNQILEHLTEKSGLLICDKPFSAVIQLAKQIIWTRDPFDRIIVAQAGLGKNRLVTNDEIILKQYPHSYW